MFNVLPKYSGLFGRRKWGSFPTRTIVVIVIDVVADLGSPRESATLATLAFAMLSRAALPTSTPIVIIIRALAASHRLRQQQQQQYQVEQQQRRRGRNLTQLRERGDG